MADLTPEPPRAPAGRNETALVTCEQPIALEPSFAAYKEMGSLPGPKASTDFAFIRCVSKQ